MTNVDTTQTRLKHVSHCFGYGGIDLGLKRIFGGNIVTIAACEIEAYAVANGIDKAERSFLDPDIPFWTNLKTFPFGAFHGLVDIYSAGFPCQPFSCAGRQQADNDPRHLWPYIRDGIARMRPQLVLLENVEAIISARLKGTDWSDPAGTPVLLHVLRELERVGYRPEAGIFSAEECGARHRRKRVFILAELANGDFERQSQLRLRIREIGRWFGNGCDELADAKHHARRSQWVAEPRERPDEGPREVSMLRRTGEKLGNATGDDQQRPSVSTMHGEGLSPGRPGGDMGNSEGNLWRCELQPSPEERRGAGSSGAGEAMDDSSSSRRIAPRLGSTTVLEGGECLPGTGCDELEHTMCRCDGGRQQNGRGEEARSEADDSGRENLADPGGLRHGGLQGPGTREGIESADWPAECRESLEHTDNKGLEGRGLCGCGCSDERPSGERERALPLHPPGPDDIEGWRRVLTIRPDLAPALSEAESALCGMADGDSNRVDRLRLCGNGVYPETVERAFCVLWERLHPRKDRVGGK